MTFKSLLDLSSKFSKAPSYNYGVERYHSGPSGGYSDSGSHWHGSTKGGGKGHGAALSALTLLAFLFLLNIMQQSLQDTNSTTTTTATAVILRDQEESMIEEARYIKGKILKADVIQNDLRKDDISTEAYSLI